MKLRCGKCRASAITEDDIVYTPKKYRETEGIHRDKAKGIICKPMPRSWHDRHAVNKMEPGDSKELYRQIVADRKPYFMRYIYPSLMKQYNTYVKNANRNALREFQMTIDELYLLPEKERTPRQKEFLRHYEYRMPVGMGNCVMNRICRTIEREFDGHIRRHNSSSTFDYTIMKGPSTYTPSLFYSIKKPYEEYNKRMQSYAVFASYERMDKEDCEAEFGAINEEFRRKCEEVCPNTDVLCNIILDLCYRRSSTKKFAWEMCGNTIIHNLLEKNDYMISFPTNVAEGDISYHGDTFSVKTKKTEVIE